MHGPSFHGTRALLFILMRSTQACLGSWNTGQSEEWHTRNLTTTLRFLFPESVILHQSEFWFMDTQVSNWTTEHGLLLTGSYWRYVSISKWINLSGDLWPYVQILSRNTRNILVYRLAWQDVGESIWARELRAFWLLYEYPMIYNNLFNNYFLKSRWIMAEYIPSYEAAR